MVYLTKAQYKFLKKLLKSETADCSALPDSQMSIIYHLESLGLLKAARDETTSYDPNTCNYQTIYGCYLSVTITEAGKSYFVEVRSERRRFLIPVAISLLALLISAISLLMQLPLCQPPLD